MIKNIIIIAIPYSKERDTFIIDIPEFRPMVIKDSTGISGFSIDLWDKIAEENDYVFKYHFIDSFPELFNRIENGI